MTRRSFLAAVAAAFVAPDADELLWRPGARLISVPAPRVFESGVAIMRLRVPPRFVVRHGEVLKVGDIFTLSSVYAVNPPRR